MKIVQVCPYDMRRPGGVQAHVRDLSHWLESQGHEVRIVAPPPRSGGPVEGVIHLGRSNIIGLHGTVTEICHVPRGALGAFVREIELWGADIVHLHTPWTPFLPWQIWRKLKLPTVATFHATLPDRGGLLGPVLGAVARFYLRRLDAAIVPSISPLAHLMGSGNILPPVVIPPAIDLKPWARAGETDRPAGAIRVVFLGRLEQRKGTDILLEAWRRLAGRVPGMRLTIAGGGERQGLVHNAMRQPWGASIDHVLEPSPEEARRLVAGADIFVAPSPYGESFGIVLIEAMAAGTVPIPAANPGYRTVMNGEGEALLVEPGDAAALAERIETLAHNAELRDRLRAWSKKHAMTYDIATVGPRFISLFQDVLDRGATDHPAGR